MMLRDYPELLNHPEYYHRDMSWNLVLNDDAPQEAHAMFDEYVTWKKEQDKIEDDW